MILTLGLKKWRGQIWRGGGDKLRAHLSLRNESGRPPRPSGGRDIGPVPPRTAAHRRRQTHSRTSGQHSTRLGLAAQKGFLATAAAGPRRSPLASMHATCQRARRRHASNSKGRALAPRCARDSRTALAKSSPTGASGRASRRYASTRWAVAPRHPAHRSRRAKPATGMLRKQCRKKKTGAESHSPTFSVSIPVKR